MCRGRRRLAVGSVRRRDASRNRPWFRSERFSKIQTTKRRGGDFDGGRTKIPNNAFGAAGQSSPEPGNREMSFKNTTLCTQTPDVNGFAYLFSSDRCVRAVRAQVPSGDVRTNNVIIGLFWSSELDVSLVTRPFDSAIIIIIIIVYKRCNDSRRTGAVPPVNS